MPRIYKQKTIDLLQKAIDKGEATFERQEYGFVTKLYLAGVRIELNIDPETGRRDGLVNILNYNTNTEYMSVWRTFAPGTFMIKDFKHDVRDILGQCPYFIVRATLNGVPVRAIVRELFEDNPKVKSQYTDLKQDNSVFTLMKMVADLDPEDDLWLTGKPKTGDIAHAAAIDEVPELENAKTKPVHEETDDENLGPEMSSTYF